MVRIAPAPGLAPDGASLSFAHAGLIVLILGSAWSEAIFSLGGLRFTGDRLLGLAAVATLPLVAIRRGLTWTPVHSALAVFAAVQALASISAAATWPAGVKFAVVYLLGFACFALAAEWAARGDGLRLAAHVWIAVSGVLGIVGGAIAFAANYLQANLWGSGFAEVLQLAPPAFLKVFAAKVTFNEWNLYSSFLLVGFALALWAWPRAGGRRLGPWPIALAGAGTALGLVFGLTRAAWVGTAALALLWLWARRPTRWQAGFLALVFAAGFAAQALAMGVSPLSFRILEPIAAGRDRNISLRQQANTATLESWRERPLLGRGSGSVNLLEHTRRPERVRVNKRWNGNIVLFVLHDSGFVGLASLLALVGVVIARTWRALRRLQGGACREVLVPLAAAGVALLFAYQFTHGLWLMYPYVYLGLLTAAMNGGNSPDAPAGRAGAARV